MSLVNNYIYALRDLYEENLYFIRDALYFLNSMEVH